MIDIFYIFTIWLDPLYSHIGTHVQKTSLKIKIIYSKVGKFPAQLNFTLLRLLNRYTKWYYNYYYTSLSNIVITNW